MIYCKNVHSKCKICSISTSHDHTFFATATGEVFSLGDGSNGKLGHNDDENYCNPKRIESLWESDIRIWSVSVSQAHSLMLSTQGDVYSCGHSALGYLQCILFKAIYNSTMYSFVL